MNLKLDDLLINIGEIPDEFRQCFDKEIIVQSITDWCNKL